MFKIIFGLVLLLTFFGVFFGLIAECNFGRHVGFSSSMFASARSIWVPYDHAKIQWAINNASEGDTIMVKAGLYKENVVVNKTVSLVGENPDTTILDGQGKGTVFYVTASHVTIRNFTLQNGYAGVWLWYSKASIIISNKVSNVAYGIRADYSGNSTISENTITNVQWFSLALDQSGNSTLQNNNLTGQRFNLRIDGNSLSDFINNVDSTNTVNGKPVYYLINQRSVTIDSSTFSEIGFLALINSTNITVRNLNLMYNGEGILFAYTTNSRISNLTASNNWNGIEAKAASNVTVIGNNANDNFDFGVKFEHSQNSIISENNVNNNGWAGIGLFTSQNSSVNANTLNNNINYGIDLVYSTNNNVVGNSVNNSRNAYSMVLYYSNFNLIYDNNFVNHFIYKQVKTTNTWNNWLEGNYWSNYNGTDANQDGIGDSPYILEEGNQDNYPLVGRFSFFNITSEYSATTISNSTIISFEFDQTNRILGLTATGRNGTLGFCRIRVPKALVNDTYTVLVDGHKPLTLKVLPQPNDEYEYIYLTFTHSPSNGIIPEFPTIPILLLSSLFIMLTLAAIILKKTTEATSKEPDGTDEKPVSETSK